MTPAARQAAWLQLTANPGLAGQDYDPQHITLTYVSGAKVPANWNPVPLSARAAAAAQPNPQLRQDKSYEALTAAIASRYGLQIVQQAYWRSIRCASFAVPAGINTAGLLTRLRSEAAGQLAAATFATLGHVAYIPNDPDFVAGTTGPQWSHWTVNCPRIWDTTRGDPSVMIAVLDTGARLTHEELKAQVIDPAIAFPDATCDVVNRDKTMEDTFGHGSAVSSIICAQGDDNLSIVGVAPLCRVLPIKISNTGTAAGYDLITAGLLADQLGARVVNCSFGFVDDDVNIHNMVDQLAADGVLFVAAVGNDSAFDVAFPAGYANALSVGATDGLDNASWFSNWGSGVDMAAPGQGMKVCDCAADDAYIPVDSGTSFAAPMVAAGAGLLWSYRPDLTLQQVRDALELHGPVAHNFAASIKRLDLLQALGAVYSVPPSIDAVAPAGPLTVGQVPDKTTVNFEVTSPSHVVRVEYTLDLAPIGTSGPEDLTLVSTAGGQFPVQFDVGQMKNQSAELRVVYFNSDNVKVMVDGGPVWIFNQRGDINGDGVVNAADIDALRPLIGRQLGDPGYVSYADTDQDGTITEADAAAVGYFYGTGRT